MSTYSSGFTSLREQPILPPKIPYDLISPQEKEKLQWDELRADISFLIKQRDSVKEDIRKLNLSVEKTKERTKADTEVKRLKIEKMQLLGQMKKVADSILSLKGNREGILKAFNKFGEERLSFLESISQSASLHIKVEDERIDVSRKELEKENELLSEMASYYEDFFKVVEEIQLANQREKARLQKDGEKIRLEISRTEFLLSEAEIKNREVDSLYSESKSENQKIKKLSLQLGKDVNKSISQLNRQKEELLGQQKTLWAEKKGLETEKARLETWQKQLNDQENRLKRVQREVNK